MKGWVVLALLAGLCAQASDVTPSDRGLQPRPRSVPEEQVPTAAAKNTLETPYKTSIGNDQYRLGVVTAITVPQPLSVGLEAIPSFDPDLSFFVEGGYFRLSFGNNRILNDWTAMVGVRYHPWSDWFLIGIEFGYRHVGFNADISSYKSDGEAPLASSAGLSLNTVFFGLIVGGQWPLSENVSIGVDLGAQLSPISWGNVTVNADQSAADPTDPYVDASDAMGRISKLPLPQIALVRLIWYI
ncbi:MAG: DUF3575 domain-containing protein [Bdellovibrionales bacterium]|nr:DUF3575 domain-containing protein [Bdellovibrionales bacterium]